MANANRIVNMYDHQLKIVMRGSREEVRQANELIKPLGEELRDERDDACSRDEEFLSFVTDIEKTTSDLKAENDVLAERMKAVTCLVSQAKVEKKRALAEKEEVVTRLNAWVAYRDKDIVKAQRATRTAHLQAQEPLQLPFP